MEINNNNIKNIIFFIIVLIIIIGAGVYFYINFYLYNKHKDINTIEYNDTIYNKIILDSIEYNIHKKDSIIINLKTEFENEKYKIYNYSDSIVIEQFKQLASSN